MTSEITSHVPTQQEIEEAEKLVNALKDARERANKDMLASIHSVEEIPEILSGEDSVKLIQVLQQKLRAGHRKVRGSPVPRELKRNLEFALKEGEMNLGQLARIFNLSVSYISRVKRDLGLSRERAGNQHHMQVV